MTGRLALPVWLLVWLLVRLPAAVPSARAAEDATIALNFQDVELPVLAKFVSEVTGRIFVLDDRVRGRVTILSPTRITPDEAYVVFQSVLQVKGFTTVPSGNFTRIVPARDAVASGTRASGEVTTRIIALHHADATTLAPVLQPLVSKDGLLTPYGPANTLVVVDAAANVERVAGLAADLDAPANARATDAVTLRYAPADDLAQRVRDTFGRDAGLRVVPDARTGTLVLSGPPDDVRRARDTIARLDVAAPPGVTRVNVYRLRYADASSLVRVLAELVGGPVPPPVETRPHGSSLARASMRRDSWPGAGYDGGAGEAPPAPTPAAATTPPPTSAGGAAAIPLEAPVRITADPATNALVVSATPADWQTLRGVIAELDIRRRQVFVEAIVLEATIDRTRALGIEFSAGGQTGGSVGLAQSNLSVLNAAAADPTSIPGLLLAAASNKMITLPNGTQVPAQSILLTALQNDTDVNVLSAPNLVTTDNEEAEIVVGRNVPFVASRATSSTNLANLFTTIERHDVGITLRLTPQITADDFVNLTLFEEVSDIDPTTVVGDPTQVGPTTTVRTASTSVAARDGQTVVIGGLVGDTVRQIEHGVPYLSRIPVVGHFFRRNDDMRTKTNLLVFLTPHVIASDAQMAANSLERRDRMREALPRRFRNRRELGGPSWQPRAD